LLTQRTTRDSARLRSGRAPGIGGVAAVLLRDGDEYVAHAELRPAKRGKLDRGREPPPHVVPR
jgi:hypothetical protein